MKRNHEADKNKNTANQEMRVELKYCERCGGLWVRECGAAAVYCESCQRIVADLPIPKKKPDRLTLPVRKPALIDGYPFEDGDEDFLDFEAGGAA